VSAASTTAAILARELGDRVTITETFGNTDAKQYFIEGIDHSNDVWDIGPRHLTGWLLSEVPSTGPFIIDVTGIGQGYIGA
jgi:hypothetical protein